MLLIAMANMSVLPIRLKEARLRAGLSQEKLGIEAGLDEMSASTRMNRYELGKRVPNPDLVEKFAKILDVPASYFYAVEGYEVDALLSLHKLSTANKKKTIEFIQTLRKK